jgi:hypothetical protein
MTKWDYHALATHIAESVAEIWENKFDDGLTAFDRIARRGEEGWELMSVCPIVANASTRQILFVFRRPRVVEPAPAPVEAPEETPEEEALSEGLLAVTEPVEEDATSLEAAASLGVEDEAREDAVSPEAESELEEDIASPEAEDEADEDAVSLEAEDEAEEGADPLEAEGEAEDDVVSPEEEGEAS